MTTTSSVTKQARRSASALVTAANQASRRAVIAQQGIPISSVAVMGFGKTQPVASNATAAGRQQNRRVELVVSGEVIGTKIGGSNSDLRSPPQAAPPNSNTAPPQPQR